MDPSTQKWKVSTEFVLMTDCASIYVTGRTKGEESKLKLGENDRIVDWVPFRRIDWLPFHWTVFDYEIDRDPEHPLITDPVYRGEAAEHVQRAYEYRREERRAKCGRGWTSLDLTQRVERATEALAEPEPKVMSAVGKGKSRRQLKELATGRRQKENKSDDSAARGRKAKAREARLAFKEARLARKRAKRVQKSAQCQPAAGTPSPSPVPSVHHDEENADGEEPCSSELEIEDRASRELDALEVDDAFAAGLKELEDFEDHSEDGEDGPEEEPEVQAWKEVNGDAVEDDGMEAEMLMALESEEAELEEGQGSSELLVESESEWSVEE